VQVVLKADGDDKLDVAREMLLEGFARLPRLHKVRGGVCCSGPRVWFFIGNSTASSNSFWHLPLTRAVHTQWIGSKPD
jgi:hypothetical protein